MALKNCQVHCTWHSNFCATCGVLVHPFLHWFQYISTHSFFCLVYQSTLYPYFLHLSLGLLCCYFWFTPSVSMSNPYNVRQESRFNPWRVKNIEKWKVLKVYYVKKCIITFLHLIFSKPCHFSLSFITVSQRLPTLYFFSLLLPLPENMSPKGKFALISQKQKQVRNRNLWEVFIQLYTGICVICHVIVQQNFLCCLWHCL